MSYSDWLASFEMCQIFNLAPDSILDNNLPNKEYLNMRLFCVCF